MPAPGLGRSARRAGTSHSADRSRTQAFAKINPVTVTADAARSFALFGTSASLGAAAAWIVGLLAVFIPLSVWRYRRIS